MLPLPDFDVKCVVALPYIFIVNVVFTGKLDKKNVCVSWAKNDGFLAHDKSILHTKQFRIDTLSSVWPFVWYSCYTLFLRKQKKTRKLRTSGQVSGVPFLGHPFVYRISVFYFVLSHE